MIITVPMLREAGLTETQINRVVEIADREVMLQRREQNRIRKQNQRARHAGACDARDARDGHIDTSLLPNQEKKEGRKKAHALSAQWVLTEADRNFAATRSWQQARIDSEADRFRDYWLANGKAKADWAATWRNWVTSPFQTSGGQNGNGRRQGSILDAGDRLREKLRQAGASEDYVPGSSGPTPLRLDKDVRPTGFKLVSKG